MKFEDLYSRIFVAEANEEDDMITPMHDEVTVPTPDKYDVEPLPLNIHDQNSGEEKLNEYIGKLQDFMEVLNGTNGDSLSKFVNDMDKDKSVFENISDTSKSVIDLAKQTASITQVLKGYIAAINRRKRELLIISKNS